MADLSYETVYELLYRGLETHKETGAGNVTALTHIRDEVHKVFEKLLSIKPKRTHEFMFSDVGYLQKPVFDPDSHRMIYTAYIPAFFTDKLEGKPEDYIKRYTMTTKSDFPLIDVAGYLGVRVVVRMTHRKYGSFSSAKNQIEMGTDTKQTFVHELAHAIDHVLPGYKYDKSYNETVAELSAVMLCRMYDIPIDIEWSSYYIKSHYNANIIRREYVEIRVAGICAFVEHCKQNLQEGNRGIVW